MNTTDVATQTTWSRFHTITWQFDLSSTANKSPGLIATYWRGGSNLCWAMCLNVWSPVNHWIKNFRSCNGPQSHSFSPVLLLTVRFTLLNTAALMPSFSRTPPVHCHLSLRQHSFSVEWAVGVKTTAIFERWTRHSCSARSSKNSSSQSIWAVPFSASGGAGWCLGCGFDRAGRSGRDL